MEELFAMCVSTQTNTEKANQHDQLQAGTLGRLVANLKRSRPDIRVEVIVAG